MNKNKIISEVISNDTTRMTSDIFLLFAKYGVDHDDVKVTNSNMDGFEEMTFFISVPSKSHLVLDSGEEASGEILAKMLKRSIIDRRIEHVKTCFEKITGSSEILDYIIFREIAESTTKLRFKVRNEEWTRQKEEESTIMMMAALTMARQK